MRWGRQGFGGVQAGLLSPAYQVEICALVDSEPINATTATSAKHAKSRISDGPETTVLRLADIFSSVRHAHPAPDGLGPRRLPHREPHRGQTRLARKSANSVPQLYGKTYFIFPIGGRRSAD